MSPHTKVNGEQDAAKKSLSFETKQIGRGIPPDRKPQAMLKEGHKHLPGLDEAVVRNIDACEQLSYIDIVALTVPSFPPWGSEVALPFYCKNKTSDAATIADELEIQHPALKILVLAGKAQQKEIGDTAAHPISGYT
ncbi:hypothetical protein B296_00029988 [Ensete ventricosum]|uniref:Uncharacterized protein n=1 Tax=Ensete ventricosum TaxID=4639 RepID=A0A426ZQT7_ENSVE|nr:hypothetical protein B296_00029988 [Ensete ventricosum]